MNLPKLSVVIPTYNEELAIEENVQKLTEYLNNLQRNLSSGLREWEVVLVNDGSTDSTLSIMQKLAASESRVKVVSYLPNRGRGYALKNGFKAATGDYIVATESDLNWGAEIIGKFVEELNKGGVDVVIASPHMKGGGMENVPFLRWLLSRAGNIIFSLAFPGKFTMVTGMTRAYRREVLDSLDLEADDKELHVEILQKAIDLGFKIKEIPAVLRWKKSEPGLKVRKSHFKLKSISKHLLLVFSVRPFLLFALFGFPMIGAGLVFGLYLLKLSLAGVAVSGRPMLFAAVLFLIVGVQTLIFGFIANQNRALRRQIVRAQKFLKK